MALNSNHPFYNAYIDDWRLMRDAYAGERVVKAKGITYLPATPGQTLDGMDVGKPGYQAYCAYKERAVFHDYVAEAVEAYIGLLHKKPATFELPAAMKGMIDKATNNGESLQTLLRSINEQQLATGRLGLLLDFPANPDPSNPLPYIAVYIGEAIRNWDDSSDGQDINNLNLVVLDETSYERQVDFEWKSVEKYRVLQMAAQLPETTSDATAAAVPGTVYMTGVFRMDSGSKNIDPTQMQPPMFRGQTLDQIPFVMVNSKDIVATPDKPPLLGLGRLSMTIYRGEADYRNQLFLQGQDTLIVIGGLQDGTPGEETVRVGAGARLDLNIGGDAKYIGVSSTGLPEVRTSLENDKNRAVTKAGQLATKMGGQKESGEALSTRLGAQTATLMQVALTGAAGLEKLLKIAAVWMGQNPDDVKVTPNMEFEDHDVDGKSIVDLMSARTMGAPLSLESIHQIEVERGLTQMSFDDEMEKIEEEDAGRVDRNKKMGIGPTGEPIVDPNEDPTKPAGSGKKPAA